MGGVGEYFDLDPIFFRLAFVLATFFGGSGVLIYIILFFVIPEENEKAKPLDSKEYTENRKQEIKEIAEKNSGRGKLVVGIIFIVLGAVFLSESYLPETFSLEKLWPIVLIFIGVAVLAKKK